MQGENPQHTLEQKEAQASLDYQWLLSDERGCRIARAVMRWSQMDAVGATKGVEEMALDAGKRQIGVLFREQLRKYAPEHWVRFEAEWLREQLEAARQDRNETRQLERDRQHQTGIGL